jgi:hypothetical protein
MAGFTDPVDCGPQHRDLDRVGIGHEALLDLGHDCVHVEGPRLRIHERPLSALERFDAFVLSIRKRLNWRWWMET